MRHLSSFVLGLALTTAVAPAANAHFKLVAPQGWLVEDDGVNCRSLPWLRLANESQHP